MWKKLETNIDRAGYGHIEYLGIDTGFEFYLRAPKVRWRHTAGVAADVESAVGALVGNQQD
jgi:hypothetical protein